MGYEDLQGSSIPVNLGKIQQEMGEKLGAQFWGFELLITPALSSTRKPLEAEHENLPFRHVHFLTIRYDTRCYFNVRSKADISQLNLPHGTDN